MKRLLDRDSNENNAEEVNDFPLEINHKEILVNELGNLEKRVMILLLLVCSIPFWPLILATIGFQSSFFTSSFNIDMTKSHRQYHGLWLVDMIKNLLGYASIFIPIYLISAYLHRIRYDEISGSGRIAKLIKMCLFDAKNPLPVISKSHQNDGRKDFSSHFQKFCSPPPGGVGYYCLMLVSGIGLQFSYLIWGVIQERIMTRSYEGESFTDSQFLVFINRFLAGLLAIFILLVKRASNPTATDSPSAPLFKYSYASLSNILSSWCQYEALKYVSFPVQILAKASKIIPVMLMGKLVKKQNYRLDEFIMAGVISIGVTFFLLDTNSRKSSSNNSQSVTSHSPISGMILLVCYMLFDSFTSNWQDSLFKVYKINSFQMMAGVNIWSCFFTVASLIEQGTLFDSLGFGLRHWDFIEDAVILSICSAFGQVFIFFTIQKFGAVVFIIIMTMRQAIAILLSCIIYGHSVHLLGVFGIFIIFLALFLRIYFSILYKTKNQSQ
uniref:Adenosine 3'-phospho 5'-phosphosulfate transporter 1 n=1 Tax=Schmidtea mediterranea TaxID=79327 RepID=A0A0H3YJH9_SCHMD|nr:slc35b-4 [Schmidtea mediterranea]